MLFLSLGISERCTQTTPCFRYERKTGEERFLVILKDTLTNNYITGEL